MAPRGNSFGFKEPRKSNSKLGPFPIVGEFGGSIPDSLYSSNKEASWNRWRRGYELATSNLSYAAFEYPFSYNIPLPSGTTQSGENPPLMAGIIRGFPTKNKELGMHWCGSVLAGSLRFDNLVDQNDVDLSIASVTESGHFWRVQLAGTWDANNPLPPPLFIETPGDQPNLTPLNGDVLEDRVLTQADIPITKETIDPNTGIRYGYTAAVLDSIEPYNGVLILRKQGSVEATFDSVLITPAQRAPQVGRFFINGSKYACSCQDFTRRQYFYVSTFLGRRKSPTFPLTKCATLKPGRYEVTTTAGEIDERIMQKALQDRALTIVAPSGYELPYNQSVNSKDVNNIPSNTNRDFPGVFSDFGNVYTRGTDIPSDPNAPVPRSEGMVKYGDYDTIPPAAAGQPNQLIQVQDTWSHLLDEYRYCKHIYAMKYTDDLFPPEPSDFPAFTTEQVAWEQRLVDETERDQRKAFDNITTYGLSYMDVPPLNVQSPIMISMMQKMLNIPASFIKIEGFTMYDKNGNAYVPASGGRPSNV